MRLLNYNRIVTLHGEIGDLCWLRDRVKYAKKESGTMRIQWKNTEACYYWSNGHGFGIGMHKPGNLCCFEI